MINRANTFLFIKTSYLITFIALIVYSYSQIDLNLTLSSFSFYQVVQQALIRLGYFNRPLSASIFGALLILLFGLYFLTIRATQRKILDSRQVWMVVFLTTILVLAYPAFSHDFFNYMFDARVVTKYGLSPYFFKALDFPDDLWTRFMRWTHRYYPYGPGWLLFSLIPSWLGLGKLTLTLLLFKLSFILFHLTNCYLIQKILMRIHPKHTLVGLVFYALNPLILIESLVSPHNEVLMLCFTLLAIYYLFLKKSAVSIVGLIISFSIKFISIVLLPLWFLTEKISLKQFLTVSFYIWLLALVPVVLSREPYSWYLIPLVGLGALSLSTRSIRVIVIGASAALLARYWPWLLIGDFSSKTQTWQLWVMLTSFVLVSLVSLLVWKRE